ncbi:MAG: substrate-binding domain-containing protein [Sphaerochaetaceae bacterium]|nr:substrate-binding domain-containing protein [Sphaerochaetaceae bacterium]
MAKLAFVEKSQGEYWDRLNAGVYSTARQRGDEVRIYAPQTVNPAAQLQYIRQAIDDGADALVVVASDPNVFAQEIERSFAAEIPVLTMDLDGYTNRRLFHFGTKPYPELGRLAAEEMLVRLKGDGPVIVQAGSNAPGACGKLQGFCDRLKEVGRQMVLIEPDFENPELALRRVQGALEDNPDVSGLFGVYAYHCVIQAQAVELSGRQPGVLPIVGFDMFDETTRRLGDGSIAASIWIAEYNIGAAATMAAGLFASHPWEEVVQFLGGSFENRQNNIRRLPISCFTKNNVSDYVQWLENHR